MKPLQIYPIQKTAEIHKEGSLYTIKLFINGQYECTDYCRKKSDIKSHLNHIGYKLTYDFTLLK